MQLNTIRRPHTALCKAVLVLAGCALLAAGAPEAAAASADAEPYIPYHTYVYDYDGNPVAAPHAYIPSRVWTGEDPEAGGLAAPSDVAADADGNVYIADTGNNRILCLDSAFNLRFELSAFETAEGPDALSGPQGLFVTGDRTLYVADTDNGRIVRFSPDGVFEGIIGPPSTSLLPEDYAYSPTALAVDNNGGLYVVATGANMGLLHFSPDGRFTGFIGAQKVAFSPVEYLWKSLLSQAQRERMEAFVPTEYNNIAMNDRGFLFVTTNALDRGDFIGAIQSRAREGKGLPVRRLNSAGDDVMVRQGYFPPVGDVGYTLDGGGNLVSSVIEDAAPGPDGSYTLMDTRKGRLFTYSSAGNLLYAFSGSGAQAGNSQTPAAIAYAGDRLLLLDEKLGQLTVFERTPYGRLIHEADRLYASYEFDACVPVWEQVLLENANYDIAYDGIGNAMMRTGDYQKAMECFEYSHNLPAYSRAFREYRNQWMTRYAYGIPVVLAALVFGLFWLFRYIGRRNTGDKYRARRLTKSGRFLYGFYILTHPFDGFWDMKKEARGSVAGATVTLALAVLTLVARQCLSGPLFQTGSEGFNPLGTVAMVAAPLLLWTVVNWSVTTLMDGKGRLRDIYMATSYSLLPVVVLVLPTIPLSYLLSLEESLYMTMLQSLAVLWSGGLIFCGNLTVHEYSAKKSVGSILLTLVGMAVVLFILLMIVTTYQRIFGFGSSIYKEITYRQ